MKQFLVAIALVFFFSSCSKDEEKSTDTTESYIGKWTLIKMSGSLVNSETTGAAMPYHEFYVFNDNGTFTKFRNKDTNQITASGTYVVTNVDERTSVELTYSTTSEIIGSCYGNQKEILYFSNKDTLSSTWQHCDGPGLDYQKLVL